MSDSKTPCQSCKQKHMKCKGGIPCENCKFSKIDCVPSRKRHGSYFELPPAKQAHIEKEVDDISDLPPIQTLQEADLTSLSKEKLRKYLRFYFISPEFTKPAMKGQMRKLIEAANKGTLTRENAAIFVSQKPCNDVDDRKSRSKEQPASDTLESSQKSDNAETDSFEGQPKLLVDCVNCSSQKSTPKCPHRRCSLCCSVAGLSCIVHTVVPDVLPVKDYPLNNITCEATRRFDWTAAALCTIFSAHSDVSSENLTWTDFFASIKLLPIATQPVIYHLNAEKDAALQFVESQTALNGNEITEIQQKKLLAERRIEELRAKLNDLLS